MILGETFQIFLAHLALSKNSEEHNNSLQFFYSQVSMNKIKIILKAISLLTVIDRFYFHRNFLEMAKLADTLWLMTSIKKH